MTAFVALIVFDFQRTEDNRVDCFPCLKVHSSQELNTGTFILRSVYISITHLCGLLG